MVRRVDWQTPFARLAVAHAAGVGGESLLAITLAGSLFFKTDPAQGRAKVLLGLMLTIAPFAIVGPLIGPMIDRGPRWSPSGDHLHHGGSRRGRRVHDLRHPR